MTAQVLDDLDAAQLRAAMVAFATALHQHASTLNALNVYPVPDGDTGTNMALTLDSVAEELAAADFGGEGTPEEQMGATCAAIAHGALMGARGNSGVILCQILRGMAARLASAVPITAAELGASLIEAAGAARAAVMRPVDGTILTVAAGAANAAERAIGAKQSLRGLLESVRTAAIEALWQTPELLDVLERAGVVDAGGAGLTLLYDALLHVVDGRPLPAELQLPPGVLERTKLRQPRGSSFASGDAAVPGDDLGEGSGAELAESGPRYEVMYLLEADDDAIPAFREVWAGIGDSIVVVGGEGVFNCHIHTDDIGGAIEAALDVGRPRRIRVTDLVDQVEEERWVRSGAERADDRAEGAVVVPRRRTAVVAVATGAGVGRILRSLGVAEVVAGGQSMNPSTGQILSAIDSLEEKEIVVLPNNANIWPVAEQVSGLSRKLVKVVPTAGVQEGFAALLEYDPEEGAERNAAAMERAAGRVVAGEVTRAVRSADLEAGEVRPGDYLGLSRAGVVVVAAELAEATCGLLDRLIETPHEIVTLVEGVGATPASTRHVTEWLAERYPEVTVELHRGGQPLYPYLVSIE